MWWTTASSDAARVPQSIDENPLTSSSALFQIGLLCCLQKSPLVYIGASGECLVLQETNYLFDLLFFSLFFFLLSYTSNSSKEQKTRQNYDIKIRRKAKYNCLDSRHNCCNHSLL